MEIWKDIDEFKGLYQVSNFGRVKSIKRKNEIIMKQPTTIDGYKTINLRINNKTYSYKIHRLVALAFIPNPLNLPEINHCDCDKTNCNDWNLEWCTHANNMKHAANNKLVKSLFGENHKLAKLTNIDVIKIRELKSTMTQKEIGKLFGIKQPTIGKILQGKLWTHI